MAAAAVALYGWPPDWSLPSLCPSCAYVEAYLKMAGVQFRKVETTEPSRAPTSVLPCLDEASDQEASLAATSASAVLAASACVAMLASRGADLDARATEAASRTSSAKKLAADAEAYLAMAEALLAPASEAALWLDPKGWPAVRAAVAPNLPCPINWAVAYRLRRSAQTAMPTQLDELYAGAVRGYDVIERLIKAHPSATPRFLLSTTHPTRLDAFAMAHVLFHLCAPPCAETPLRAALEARPEVTRWATRLAADVFAKEGDAQFAVPMPLPPPPPPPRAPPQPSSARSDSGASPSGEERAYRRNNVLAVVGALGAMVLYALMSLEWVDDEEDEVGAVPPGVVAEPPPQPQAALQHPMARSPPPPPPMPEEGEPAENVVAAEEEVEDEEENDD